MSIKKLFTTAVMSLALIAGIAFSANAALISQEIELVDLGGDTIGTVEFGAFSEDGDFNGVDIFWDEFAFPFSFLNVTLDSDLDVEGNVLAAGSYDFGPSDLFSLEAISFPVSGIDDRDGLSEGFSILGFNLFDDTFGDTFDVTFTLDVELGFGFIDVDNGFVEFSSEAGTVNVNAPATIALMTLALAGLAFRRK